MTAMTAIAAANLLVFGFSMMHYGTTQHRGLQEGIGVTIVGMVCLSTGVYMFHSIMP